MLEIKVRANECINRDLPFGFQPATSADCFQIFDFPLHGCKDFSSSDAADAEKKSVKSA
jgi:hypothetical protein